MQQRYSDILAEGAQVVAVSTDNLNGAERAVTSFGIDFPILYTARNPDVPASYDAFNRFGDGLASASVFLITDGSDIRWEDLGDNYRHLVDAETVLGQLRKLDL